MRAGSMVGQAQMYSGRLGWGDQERGNFNEISVAASRKRNGYPEFAGGSFCSSRDTRATLNEPSRSRKKTSPRTVPRAWSQLLPPRREATKLDAFLRLAERTLSR